MFLLAKQKPFPTPIRSLLGSKVLGIEIIPSNLNYESPFNSLQVCKYVNSYLHLINLTAALPCSQTPSGVSCNPIPRSLIVDIPWHVPGPLAWPSPQEGNLRKGSHLFAGFSMRYFLSSYHHIDWGYPCSRECGGIQGIIFLSVWLVIPKSFLIWQAPMLEGTEAPGLQFPIW